MIGHRVWVLTVDLKHDRDDQDATISRLIVGVYATRKAAFEAAAYALNDNVVDYSVDDFIIEGEAT